jgi:hypothetical protein
MTLSARSRPFDATAVLGRARIRFASRLRRWVAARWREAARGRALPAAVSAEFAFERGERVLSVSRDRDGECALVATDRALYHRVLPHRVLPHRVLPHRADADGWSRLGWEQIARVGWDAAAGQLVIIGLADVAGLAGAAPPRTTVPLRGRGTVPELAQERVTHTKLGQWHLLVAGTHRVLVEVRRRPVTGELLWFVTSGANGSGSSNPDIGAHVERAVARLLTDFGVTPQSGTGLSLSQAPVNPTEGAG